MKNLTLILMIALTSLASLAQVATPKEDRGSDKLDLKKLENNTL